MFHWWFGESLARQTGFFSPHPQTEYPKQSPSDEKIGGLHVWEGKLSEVLQRSHTRSALHRSGWSRSVHV
jgi:hypothetical protein